MIVRVVVRRVFGSGGWLCRGIEFRREQLPILLERHLRRAINITERHGILSALSLEQRAALRAHLAGKLKR